MNNFQKKAAEVFRKTVQMERFEFFWKKEMSLIENIILISYNYRLR